MVPLELLEHPLRLFDAQAVLHGEVVVERQVPLRVLVGRHTPPLRMLRHRIVPAEIERAEAERMDVVLVLFEEFHRLPGLLSRFTWEAEEAHAVVPDAR